MECICVSVCVSMCVYLGVQTDFCLHSYVHIRKSIECLKIWPEDLLLNLEKNL